MFRSRLGRTLALTLLVLGCSNPKTASKGTFKTALQAWWDKNPPCAYVYIFPAVIDLSNQSMRADQARLDTLKTAGLLTSQTNQKAVKDPYGGPAPVRTVTTYSPGGPNSAAWHHDARGGDQLCYAKVKVNEVTNFTEPSDVFGMKASQVAYTATFIDFPSWAKDPKVQAAVPQIETSMDKPDQDQTDTLLLTANGWSKDLK